MPPGVDADVDVEAVNAGDRDEQTPRTNGVWGEPAGFHGEKCYGLWGMSLTLRLAHALHQKYHCTSD